MSNRAAEPLTATKVEYIPPRSLHRKLAQVMYEAERIPKNGQAPREMGGYRFVQVGDAADHIRKALAEKVITMVPSKVEVLDKTEHTTKAGGSMTTVDLRVTWTLTDGESGETATIESYGAGADGGDKYSGKATTSAMKYALLAGFLLSTGEDTEASPLTERLGPQDARLPEPREVNGLIGKLVAQGSQDFQLRETPDGWVLPFRVKEGNKTGTIVVAEDGLATALDLQRDVVLDSLVTVWGTFSDETLEKGGRTIAYRVLHLSRIKHADFELPASEATPEPLWDDALAEIDAELAPA